MELVPELLAIALAMMPIRVPSVEYVPLDFALDLYPTLAAQPIAVPVVWIEQLLIVAEVGTRVMAVVALPGLVPGLALLALAAGQVGQQLEHVRVIDAMELPWPLDSLLQ